MVDTVKQTILTCGGESPRLGGKAESLLLMQNSGFNVPAFFVVAGCCFEPRADEAGREGAALRGEAQAAVRALLDGEFARARLFAVRSSASVEDTQDASFAGKFDTFLRVPRGEVPGYIVRCYLSRFHPAVEEYCREKGLDARAFDMNVVVQEMVEAEFAGVVFTANPQGLLNESVMVCGAGTGDNTVGDKTPVTTYYRSKTDGTYYYETQPSSPVFEDALAEKIFSLAADVETRFGKPADIEFAVKGGEVFLLQARPITALGAPAVILDNSNIVESYPGITLPLTGSFVREAYYGVFRSLAARCLKNRRLLAGYDNELRNMVASANGRMYYQINNWYAVLGFLPMSKKIIPMWQDMMGVSEKEYRPYVKNIPRLQSLRISLNCVYEALRVQKGMRSLNGEFASVIQYFRQAYRPGLTTGELEQIYRDTSAKVLAKWDITLLNDIYTFVFTGLLKKRLKKTGAAEYERLTNDYIAGVSNIESIKPVRALIALAQSALEYGLLDELRALDSDGQARAFLAGGSVFAAAMNEYIRDYGDRSLEELKLESRTFRTSPLLLVKKILEYGADAQKLAEMSKAVRGADARAHIGGRGGFLDRRLIRFFAGKAMGGIANREISRLNRSRVYGIARTLFLDIGANLAAEGLLERAEDIFYLTAEEAFGRSGTDYRTAVVERKREYHMYAQLPAFSRLVFSGPVFNKSHRNINARSTGRPAGEAYGTPCSNGKAEGEALVVEKPSDAENAAGKILVTKMTDPGWVFLLAAAKGVIAEKGSLLSHTAIISRELGVPSIVGAEHITEMLNSGDIVRMDGGTGKIEVVKRFGA